MERADLGPVIGVGAEIGGGLFGARGADLTETLAVADQDRLVLRQPLDDGLREARARAFMGQPEEGPGAFALALDEAGAGHQLQMARNAGLGLAEDFGEVGDVQLAVRQQREEAQARRLARGAQGAENGGKRGVAARDRTRFRHKDIFMRSSRPTQEGRDGKGPFGRAHSDRHDAAHKIKAPGASARSFYKRTDIRSRWSGSKRGAAGDRSGSSGRRTLRSSSAS